MNKIVTEIQKKLVDFSYSPQKKFVCRQCFWESEMKDMLQSIVGESVLYKCPNCHYIIKKVLR